MKETRIAKVYLVLQRIKRKGSTLARVVACSMRAPDLKTGQVAVPLEIAVPDAAFEPGFDPEGLGYDYGPIDGGPKLEPSSARDGRPRPPARRGRPVHLRLVPPAGDEP